MGAHFEAPDEAILLAPLDLRYTQVGFNLVSIQVWEVTVFHKGNGLGHVTSFGHFCNQLWVAA